MNTDPARPVPSHDALLDALERLALAVEYREDPTGQHPLRVGRLSADLAAALGLPADRIDLLRLASPLHDVGKIAVPDDILLKPGLLTTEEFEVMRQHAVVGGRILAGGRSPLFLMAEQIALTHHENWDGTGYPDGLPGEDIPLVGRVVAVADVFDAMTHARTYKPAWGVARAVEEIRTQSGRKFDPAVVAALLAHPASKDGHR